MANCPSDPVMGAIRRRFEQSGMSLEALGTKMGYPKETARKSAWQFIKRTNDPRLSMIRKFANATGVPLKELAE
jgi:transcriptional regulator with XRE-family HTH domain